MNLIHLEAQLVPSIPLGTRLRRAVTEVFSSPAAVFLLALIARFTVLNELFHAPLWGKFLRYNEQAHIAWALASGLGFSAPWPNTPIAPTAQQPPIYPLLLAGIFKLAGAYSYPSLWLAITINAVISAATAMLILKLGRRDFGSAAGILAAWVWSCWIYEATVSVRLWDSSLSVLLLMAGIWLWPRMRASPNLKIWLGFGALAGIAAQTNTTLLSVFLVFWLGLWIIYRNRSQSCTKALLVSVGACVLILLPWTIRNYRTFHRLMPVRDNFGLELWVGIEVGPSPKPVITRFFPLDFPLSNPAEYNRMGEIAFMDSRRQLAVQFIRDYPREYFHMVVVRCLRYWSEPRGSPWWIISALAWIGVISALAANRLEAWPYIVVLLVFPLVYYVTHTFPTYRHPMEPVILLPAAYAVTQAASKILGIWRSRQARHNQPNVPADGQPA